MLSPYKFCLPFKPIILEIQQINTENQKYANRYTDVIANYPKALTKMVSVVETELILLIPLV